MLCFGLLGSICFAATEGKLAPPFEAKQFDGEKFSLAANAGHVVVVHFWASWCEACRNEMAALNEYYTAHKNEGLRMIAINMDDPKSEAKARELAKGFAFPWAFARDSAFKPYGRIWRLPLTFVIDRGGILRKDGWIVDHALASDDLTRTLTPLLAR